ncbi:MAG TPA: hypothetical protein VGZ23_09155 [bacterium]|nr:hypothetical protein [bacterium]
MRQHAKGEGSDGPQRAGPVLTPFERFAEFTRRIVAVPKSEIQEQERLYQRRQRAKKRRKQK